MKTPSRTWRARRIRSRSQRHDGSAPSASAYSAAAIRASPSLEDRQLLVRAALPSAVPMRSFADLRADVLCGRGLGQEVARLVDRRLAAVDEVRPHRGHRRRCRAPASSGCFEVSSRRGPCAPGFNSRFRIGSRQTDSEGDMASRTASSADAGPPPGRGHASGRARSTTTRSKSRTARIAFGRWPPPGCPRRESPGGRAWAREQTRTTPETAGEHGGDRAGVQDRPRSRRSRRRRARRSLMRVEAARAVPGKIATAFSAYSALLAAPVRGEAAVRLTSPAERTRIAAGCAPRRASGRSARHARRSHARATLHA